MRAKTTRDYLANIGRKGGQSGTGDAKRRGDSDHYRKLAERSAAARRARKEQTKEQNQ